MKKRFVLWALMVLFISVTSFREKGDAKVLVTGKVMHTGAACGGVELSPDEYAWIATPKPFANKKIYVKKGIANDLKAKPVLEFTTAADGTFAINLPPGDYCFVDEFKKDKKNYTNILKNYSSPTKDRSAVDKECLDKWFSTPDATLTIVHMGVKDFTITYADKCGWDNVPCTIYNGPLPP